MAVESKKKEMERNNKKRNYSAVMQPEIRTAFFGMTKPSADAAILQFIAPSIVEEPVFRNLIVALRDAGTNYVPPKRHALGLNSSQTMTVEMHLVAWMRGFLGKAEDAGTAQRLHWSRCHSD